MKYNLIIIVLCGFFILSFEKAESQPGIDQQKITKAKETINNQIKELRKQKISQPDTIFRIDSLLSQATAILSSDTFRIKRPEIDNNEIRKLLRKKGIYDYQVNYIKIPLNDLDAKTIKKQLNNHSELLNQLDKLSVNRLGIALEKANEKYTAHILLIEHYVELGSWDPKTLDLINYYFDYDVGSSKPIKNETFEGYIILKKANYYVIKSENYTNIQQQVKSLEPKAVLMDNSNHFQLTIKDIQDYISKIAILFFNNFIIVIVFIYPYLNYVQPCF